MREEVCVCVCVCTHPILLSSASAAAGASTLINRLELALDLRSGRG